MMNPTNAVPLVIGATATYTGTAHPWMTGLTVKVVSVIREGDDGEVFTDDDLLAAAGGLASTDMLEVVPWMGDRFSWVTSDAQPSELAGLGGRASA